MSGAGRPVAFLGLGLMGLPMSRNLARAGFEVRAWNRTPLDAAPEARWSVAASAAQACEGAEVVVTMLPGLAPVVDVLTPLLEPGQTVLVMGTTSPVGLRAWAAQVAAAGVGVVDAPVSGGDVGAEAGTLSIMVGGAEADVERVAPLLAAMGTTVRHLGAVGSGQLAKACNQVVVATTLAVLGEAATLAAHHGLDVEGLFDVLAGGLAGSRVLEVKGAKIAGHEFTPGGLAVNQHHDLGFALEAGRAGGVAMPVTALVDQLFGAMRWTGRGGQDHSGVVQVIEDLSGSSTSRLRESNS